MENRKEALFRAKQVNPPLTVIPATVKFRHNKSAGIIEELQPHEKMICALRKVLTAMSEKDDKGRRFYIANNRIQITQAPTESAGKAGSGRTYKASGKCKLGASHPGGHMTTTFVEFTVSYRDTMDDRGLADVEYFDPTSIDAIDRKGGANLDALL